MNLKLGREDEAEQTARREMQKRGKRMLLLCAVSCALFLGAKLLHLLLGIPDLYWIGSVPLIFIVGEAFGWYEVSFQELRTRTKEINGKLTDIECKLGRIENGQAILNKRLP